MMFVRLFLVSLAVQLSVGCAGNTQADASVAQQARAESPAPVEPAAATPPGSPVGTTAETSASPSGGQPAEMDYGEALYENHCRVCHNNAAFVRENSKVHTRADLEYFVRRWSDHLKLQWDDVARKAVADHLNRKFYRFEAEEHLH